MKSAVLERNPAETNPLRKWREARDVGVKLVAARIGVSSTTIREWEAGSISPSDANLERLARLLKVSVADLRETWERWLRRIAAA